MHASASVTDLNSLHLLDTRTLRAELRRAISVTVENIRYLAAIWEELTKRKEDLSEFKSGLAGLLPLIANGSLLPEVAVRIGGNVRKVKAISSLSVADQRRVATGEKIPVLRRSLNGEEKIVRAPIEELTVSEVCRTIRNGKIVPPERQAGEISTRDTNLRTERLIVHLTAREKLAAARLADAKKMNLGDWMRNLVLREIGKL